MSSLIRGITVRLYVSTQTGVDAFNAPIYAEYPVFIENVLVSPVGTEDIVAGTQLYGKKAVYELSIPKDDTHDWQDKRVEFFGQMWRTFGIPMQYVGQNVPLDWNIKVKVERYG